MSVTSQKQKNRSKTNTLTKQNAQKRLIKAKTKSVKKITTVGQNVRQLTTSQWFGIRAKKKQHILNMRSQNGQKQRQLNGQNIANPTLKEDLQRSATRTTLDGTRCSELQPWGLNQVAQGSSLPLIALQEFSAQKLEIRSQSFQTLF